MGAQACFPARWPGNFPEHHVCAMSGKKWCEWVLPGRNGFAWVGRGAGSRAERKTTEKEAQMVVLHLFCDACQGEIKTESWQGWSRWSERVMGVNGGKERG